MSKPKNQRRMQDVPPADVRPPMPPDVGPNDDDDNPPPMIDGKPTVNGQPIPEAFAHAIAYRHTDQGIWEHNRGKVKGSGIEVIGSDWDNSLARRADEMGQPGSRNPFEEAIDQVRQPGFEYRVLSERVVSRRGSRGYEAVKDQNGSNVKVGHGSTFIGRIPIDIARRRRAVIQDRTDSELADAAANGVAEQQRVLERAGRKGKGISVLQPGDSLTDSRNPDREALIGFEQFRGERAA